MTHQGAALCAYAIHKAQAELAANAAPARRTPHWPLPGRPVEPRRRSHNQGPNTMVRLVPAANSAITIAPAAALPASAATSRAE